MKLIELVRRTIFTTSHGAVFVKYGKYEPHKAGMHDFFRTKFGFGGHICWWRNSCEVEELLHLTLLRTGGEKTTFSFVFFSSRRQNLVSKGGGTLDVTPPGVETPIESNLCYSPRTDMQTSQVTHARDHCSVISLLDV